MKKTVIKYHKVAHGRAISSMNAIRIIVENFRSAYSKFQDDTEIDDLDKATLIDIMESGRSVIEQKIDSYVEKQKKPLQRYFSEESYKALKVHLDPILRKVEFWKEQRYRGSGDDYFPNDLIYPKNWPWSDDLTLIVDKTFEENIRPFFEITISSELDRQLLKKYEDVARSYNELMALAYKNNVLIPKSFNILFKTDGMTDVEHVRL